MFIQDVMLMGHDVNSGSTIPVDLDQYDVLIMTTYQIETSIEPFLQNGGGLIVFAPLWNFGVGEFPSYHPLQAFAGHINVRFTTVVDPENPLVQGLAENSDFAGLAGEVVLKDSVQVAVQWNGGIPLAATFEYENSRIAYFNFWTAFFDVSESSWSLDHEYGISLMTNALKYVTGVIDCNDNGIPDEDDLIIGTSEDCNNNLRPDECESATDCNANGIQDICDLAEGTANDCNNNFIPDQCDLAAGLSPDCNGNLVPDQCDIESGFSSDVNENQIPDICETDCNQNGVPDAFEIIEGLISDCNNNLIPDECDMEALHGVDCNGNDVLDECDIVDGTSFDVNDNCIPDECNQYPMPLAEEFPVKKNRYVTFTPVNYSCNTAIRITLVSLHHPDPPTLGSPDFTEFEGQVRWAGPPNIFAESASGRFFLAASQVQCEPYFTDWSSGVPGSSLLHLFGNAIVPSSTYLIEVVGDDCVDLNDPSCYSDALEVHTGRWGDIVSPLQNVDGSHQPTIADVMAVVRKWKGNLEPIKASAQLKNNVPNPSNNVNISDVFLGANAWRGFPYPYDGPASCP